MARAPKIDYMEVCPWTFRGEKFEEADAAKYAGFVYLITNKTDGRMYVGKKFFWGMRKQKGKTRRSKTESDWRRYFGSCKALQDDVKSLGAENFTREMLSLHTLKRDVNFCEVREQWIRDVLETLDADGNRVYYNENIQGRFFPGLVIGWKERSELG